MGWAAGERNPRIYAGKGRISRRDHIWVQDALTVSVEMFRQMGLETKLEKTKDLVCSPGYNWGKWSEAA